MAARRVHWPDPWVPLDRADALAALTDALGRARAGERVEVACSGGAGRTGTALAALAVLDGLPSAAAVRWVRERYSPRAVETPWRRRWLRTLGPAQAPSGGSPRACEREGGRAAPSGAPPRACEGRGGGGPLGFGA